MDIALGRLRQAVDRARSLVHPAPRATVESRVGPAGDAQPALVSVVVPFYAVESYFAECLTSVLSQSYRELQVILVDDGSPDSSLAIAQDFARRDGRVEILRQPNRGLGAARNAGVAAARGRYVCFVDSDDLLPADAIAILVSSLEQTGSDFAVGSLHRLVGLVARVPGWATEVHDRDRLGVTVDAYPEILRNVFAWNKLYVREFFDREVGGFPEGIRYEDQEATARAYVAGRFDVLRAVVYVWRKRDDASSLTQQKADPADLADRLLVKERTAQILAEGAAPATFEGWLAKALGIDLRPYLAQVPETGPEFWTRLRQGVLGLASRMTDQTWLRVGLIDRLPVLALLAGHREDVVRLMVIRDAYGWSLPGAYRDDTPQLDQAYLSELEIRPPAPLLAYAPQDIRVLATVTDWEWTPTVLRLVGTAWLTNLPASDELTTIEVAALAGSGARVRVPTAVLRSPTIDQRANDAWNSHAYGAFEALVDLGPQGLDPDETWTLHIAVAHGSLVRSAPLGDRDTRGRAGTVPVRPADASGRWLVSVGTDGADGAIVLEHRRTRGVLVGTVEVRGDRVTVAVADRRVSEVRGISTTGGQVVRATVDPSRAGVFHLDLPRPVVAEVDPTGRIWRLTAAVAGRFRKLLFPGDDRALAAATPDLGTAELQVRPDGALRAVQHAHRVVADRIELDGSILTVTGRLSEPASAPFTAALTSDGTPIPFDSVTLQRDAGSFRASLNLAARPPVPLGRFAVTLSAEGGEAVGKPEVGLSPDLVATLPRELRGDQITVTAGRSRGPGTLRIRLDPPYAPEERGRLAQRRLHTGYQGARPPLREAILFESCGGAAVADNPLGIFAAIRARAPHLELYWSVADLRTPVPASAIPLLRHSRAWLGVLGAARYLVNNDYFPFSFRKRDGQIYVQTWHGTPVARTGFDAPATGGPAYRQTMRREAASWDFLLAQNDFAATVLPAALGYRGPVVCEGYPRTDGLLSGAATDRRAAVRSELGVATSGCAVAYLPAAGNPSRLHWGEIGAAFGDRVVLLDPSHQSLSDLLLAADVLVTDYSPMLFDFCLTGKPMVFLVPDRAPALYLDFADVAPGPICTTTAAVVGHLRDLGALTREYAERYRSFHETYLAKDDGQAGRRVVDTIWGPAPPE